MNRLLAAGCLTLIMLAPGRAVILYGTSNILANTTAPTGSLLGSGWQYQGNWGAFLGTPIAPNFFLTAKHVGGSVGMALGYNGSNYITTAKYDSPTSDLTLWRIAGAFPTYAPIYTSSNEVGLPLVVFGRGTRRGAEFLDTNGVLKGWEWGIVDGVRRWGTNVVNDIVDAGPAYGDLLYSTFDAGGSNEAHLSVGDSSGGLFVYSGGGWHLAGINFAVDGPFGRTNGTYTNAALFDAGGVWLQNSPTNQLLPDLPFDIPSGFYATRISDNLSFINSVVPEPASAVVLLAGAAASLTRRRRR